jgi:hypothetical protein
MTLHLDNRLSMLNTRKPRQKKLTKAQQERFAEEHRQYNKRMKQQGRHSERMTFDEYVDRVYGNGEKPKKSCRQNTLEVNTYVHRFPDTSRSKHYPSVDTGKGLALMPEKKTYTGTLIKGIATMHKSNAVPVLGEEDATAIANMRR